MKFSSAGGICAPPTGEEPLPWRADPAAPRHEVNVFLLGPAVEIERVGDERFDVHKLLLRFDELGGVILSCGTCLRIREMDAGALCPMSTMDDLVRLTEESDRVLTFG